jgi:hypothetical protein
MVKAQLLQAGVCTLFAGPELPWAQIALHAEVVRTDKTPKQMQICKVLERNQCLSRSATKKCI